LCARLGEQKNIYNMHTEGEGKRRGEQSPHATRSRAVGLAIWRSTLTQTHFAIANGSMKMHCKVAVPPAAPFCHLTVRQGE